MHVACVHPEKPSVPPSSVPPSLHPSVPPSLHLSHPTDPHRPSSLALPSSAVSAGRVGCHAGMRSAPTPPVLTLPVRSPRCGRLLITHAVCVTEGGSYSGDCAVVMVISPSPVWLRVGPAIDTEGVVFGSVWGAHLPCCVLCASAACAA